MKMNENEWKREDEVELVEEWNPTRLLKHLRPPRRGLFRRCWSLLQASCLPSASLCFWPRLAPRAIIILSTIICVCFTIHFGVVGDTVRRPIFVRGFLVTSFAEDTLLSISVRYVSTILIDCHWQILTDLQIWFILIDIDIDNIWQTFAKCCWQFTKIVDLLPNSFFRTVQKLETEVEKGQEKSRRKSWREERKSYRIWNRL